MIRLRLCIFGKKSTEMTCPSYQRELRDFLTLNILFRISTSPTLTAKYSHVSIFNIVRVIMSFVMGKSMRISLANLP